MWNFSQRHMSGNATYQELASGFLTISHQLCGQALASSLRQAADEGVYLAQHIRFVRDKNKVTCIGQPNHAGGWNRLFKSVCLGRCTSQITSRERRTSSRIVLKPASQVVGNGEYGEDRDSDVCVLLLTV